MFGLGDSGTIQLFRNSTCTTSASSPQTITGSTETITANSLTDGIYNFYVKYIDGSGNSSCSSGISYRKGVNFRMLLHDPSRTNSDDSTPTFQVSGLCSGTIQLFSDSSCSTSASGSVAVDSDIKTITANPLAYGDYNFYVKYTDGGGNSACSASSVRYKKVFIPKLALSDPSQSCNNDATPTFQVSGLGNSGTIQLFRNSTCTTSASSPQTITGSTETITANSLTNSFTDTVTADFYVKYTDGNDHSECSASVHYKKAGYVYRYYKNSYGNYGWKYFLNCP